MQKLIDIGYQLENFFFYIFKEIRKNRPDRNRSDFSLLLFLFLLIFDTD